LHSPSSLALSEASFLPEAIHEASEAFFLVLSVIDHPVTWVLLFVIAFSRASLLCVILLFLNLYDSSIDVIAQVLALAISVMAFSFSTLAAVLDSLAVSPFSLVTLSTSPECSVVLLSSASDCFSSACDFQKVLVADTKLLSKNFLLASQKHTLSASGAGSAPANVFESHLMLCFPWVPVTANESLIVEKKSFSFLSLSTLAP